MSANNRVTLAVHTLVWIAMSSRESEQLATSEQVAASVNTNPVVIRRILGQLKAAGIVESRRGAGAGWLMSRAPATVTLADVYDAVEPGSLFALHAAEPNQTCRVGRGIQPSLTALYDRVGQVLRDELAAITIADVVDDVSGHARRRPAPSR
jgi:Rrf2 family protein